jgi:hypothetical protein
MRVGTLPLCFLDTDGALNQLAEIEQRSAVLESNCTTAGKLNE